MSLSMHNRQLVLGMFALAVLLTGCDKKQDIRLASTLLLGGIILLATVCYLPVIMEVCRKKTADVFGRAAICKISNIFFYVTFGAGGITWIATLPMIPLHVRNIWLLWNICAFLFVFFQYRFKFIPILDDDERKDARKAILGKIRTIVFYTIIYGYILVVF